MSSATTSGQDRPGEETSKTPAIEPDAPPVASFLEALFAPAVGALLVEVRAVHPDGKVEQRFHQLRALRAHGFSAITHSPLGGIANLYYSACPRGRPEGGKDAVACATAAWSDLDHGQPSPWPSDIPPPSAVVETSPGRLQCYWLLDATTDVLERLEAVNRRLASALGGDLAATDAARVLRLPGFPNMKYPARPIARILSLEPSRRYTLTGLETTVAGTPDLRGARAGGPPGNEAPISEGQRHIRLLSLAGAMRRRGAGQETILVALRSFNAARCSPPLEEREVEALARSMVRYPEWPQGARSAAPRASRRHPLVIVRRPL